MVLVLWLKYIYVFIKDLTDFPAGATVHNPSIKTSS